ncbi:MAG: SAF domain-containing protein [Actinomycetota bacterium]|nr:SAF domain-containing protein [Actinomycetota bacterium]
MSSRPTPGPTGSVAARVTAAAGRTPTRRNWRGTGRRAMWRRGQVRRLAAAALVGLAGWAAVTALSPASGDAGSTVLVAAHDIPAGSPIALDAVHAELRPARLLPDGALTDIELLAGGVAAGPVRAGEVLTDVRVTPAMALHGLADGRVLVHVPLSDPAMAAAVRPGTRVDVLSTVDGSIVAGDALAVAASPAGVTAGDDPSARPGSGFFAAVGEGDAARLAVATDPGHPAAGVMVVIRSTDAPTDSPD